MVLPQTHTITKIPLFYSYKREKVGFFSTFIVYCTKTNIVYFYG